VDGTAITDFCTQSSVVVVAGKGGVGKSTVSATLARLAARSGLSALLIRLDDWTAPDDVQALFLDEVELTGGSADEAGRWARIRTRTITPDDVVIDYLVHRGFGRAARRLVKSGMIDVAATAIPGVRDVLVLGKIVQLEQAHTADLIVVDGPAAGHVTTFLTSAQGLLDASRVGPVHAQAAEVVEFLHDPARCRVVLVALAEETPVNETTETAHTLEKSVGTRLGPVVVNCLYPRLGDLDVDPEAAAAAADVTLQPGEAEAIRAAAVFRRRRQEMQAEQVTRLVEALPLPQVCLPQLFSAEIGPPQLDLLADALETGLVHLGTQTVHAGPAGPTKDATGTRVRERDAAGIGPS
jgi:anion-transporting  ArsA/GET3 family ATPase